MDNLIKKGSVVTISRNNRTGDRSYSKLVYRVICHNETHWKVMPVRLSDGPEIEYFWNHPHIILKDEFDLTPAGHFL